MTPRSPAPNELMIALLIDDSFFYSWTGIDRLDDLMDSFEERAKLSPESRSDQIVHMRLRVQIARDLRRNGCERAWQEVLGAGSLWLGLRHYSNGGTLARGIETLAPSGAVLTISVGHSPGCFPDTAWAFMVGTKVHDGRKILADTKTAQVLTFEGARLD